MELRLERGALADAVLWTARTLSKSPGALSGILLQATDEAVTLSSYDLDMSSKITISADVAEVGTVLVPGKLLLEISRSLPQRPVQLIADTSRVLLKCGRSEFKLPLLPQEEYPQLPSLPPIVGHTSGEQFAKAVSQTVVAASKSDASPVFAGVRMEITEDGLTMAATDRYRLAVRELDWSAEVGCDEFGINVPARGLADAAKSLTHAEQVSLALMPEPREIGIEAGQRRFTSRLIDGKFPRFRDIIDTPFRAEARVSTDELREAVKRVALVAEPNTPVRLDIHADEMELRAGTAEETSAHEALECQLTGPELAIAFNPTFLLDGLAELDASITVISANVSDKPAVLMGAADLNAEAEFNYRYLLMPMRF